MTKTAGFVLIELRIVVAIICTLAIMAVPTFIAYRDRSRVTQVVGSSEAIRSAFASASFFDLDGRSNSRFRPRELVGRHLIEGAR